MIKTTQSAIAISLALAGVSLLTGCSSTTTTMPKKFEAAEAYGTLNPYASEAVYFLLTDRFVDGDESNNQVNQGGKYKTFDRPLIGPDGQTANVGYLGGDFKGVINNAQYIKDMGFTSVWTTPIFDNPDEAFSGGEEVTYGAYYKDGGKTGYHGYWGVNFFKVDEHLESKGLTFADFTKTLKEKYDLNYVLDIVGNHGSPSYSMPADQPTYGEIYDENDKLIADHQNIHPEKLDMENPMHQFFNTHTGLAQLSDLNENNPEVLDYFERAYLKWIAQGSHSLRVDTIKEMPHHFWKKLFDRIRKVHPDIFIFGESYSYEAEFIAEHTYSENGGASVLDFPGRQAIIDTFEKQDSHYKDIQSYLHLDSGVYANPYELMTFYDNHDMTRMNATDEGFIDANNWLFTSRGIPVIYYGSEINFMTGRAEHEGNRNYFGQENVEKAKTHPIHENLTRIAHVRKENVALQRGLQINLPFEQHTAAFYRVYQNQGESQTALVMLNKGDRAAEVKADMVSAGEWIDVISGQTVNVAAGESTLTAQVPAHGVAVWIFDRSVNNAKLNALLVKHQSKLKI